MDATDVRSVQVAVVVAKVALSDQVVVAAVANQPLIFETKNCPNLVNFWVNSWIGFFS